VVKRSFEESEVSNLVFISGDFSSGSTLLWTLFRKTGEYYSLYEPLHDKLPEYLLSGHRVYEHHYFVDDYFAEFKGFHALSELFKPEWGFSSLYLPATAEAPGLYRYLSYLIGTSFARAAKVLIKENRLTFRLGWIRARFPGAKILHIYRQREKQWASIVRRAQEYLGKEDVGQGNVTFGGMSIAQWCEDLKEHYPELRAECSKTGYERFCKLWEASYAENRRYADLSIDYGELTHNYEAVAREIQHCVRCQFDLTQLKQLIVPPDKQKPIEISPAGLRKRMARLIDRVETKQARLRLRLRSLLRGAPD
jgi:hypothetical protein